MRGASEQSITSARVTGQLTKVSNGRYFDGRGSSSRDHHSGPIGRSHGGPTLCISIDPLDPWPRRPRAVGSD